MKKKITELNAVAAVMDSVFQQVDEKWGVIWEPAGRMADEIGMQLNNLNFIKLNFQIAALSVNMRSLFDLVPRVQSERMFTILQDMLKHNLGNDKAYYAVVNMMKKYIEAYNAGIIKIASPLREVAMLLYYKIGLGNTEQTVVDEHFYVPDPRLLDYLTNAITMFSGKWEHLLNNYELVHATGRAPEEDESPDGE